jgi:hypothetical protein
MSRSQAHKVVHQGVASNGEVVAEGKINSKVAAALAAAAPTLTSLNPATAVHGAAALTVHAIGTKFTAGCKIVYGRTALPTTLVSATDLSASVTPGATAGTVPVVVRLTSSGYSVDTPSKPFNVT